MDFQHSRSQAQASETKARGEAGNLGTVYTNSGRGSQPSLGRFLESYAIPFAPFLAAMMTEVGVTPRRYEAPSIEEVKIAIVEIVKTGPMRRPQIYEAIVPSHFLRYRRKDYRSMIDDLVFKENRLFADERTQKRKSQLNDQTLLSTTPWPGGKGE